MARDFHKNQKCKRERMECEKWQRNKSTTQRYSEKKRSSSVIIFLKIAKILDISLLKRAYQNREEH